VDKAIIVTLMYEGGGAFIYGRQVDGVWSFWQEGAAMADDNDEGQWNALESSPVSELSAALPPEWWRMVPREVHPEFATELHEDVKRHLAGSESSMAGYRLAEWARLVEAGKAT